MNNSIKIIILISSIFWFAGCTKKSEENKPTIQVLADKEKELNDREARVKLKEVELEEREKKIVMLENGITRDTSSTKKQTTDTSKMTKKDSVKANDKKQTKKEIQSEITKKFENPSTTVKDYYEYIKRGITETGNFDANMKKANKYFPSRSGEKLKSSYRNAKSFTILEEPKVLSQKDDNATVVAKVQQVNVVKKDGTDTEVTKTYTVTYNLKANKDGQWVIVSNVVKE